MCEEVNSRLFQTQFYQLKLGVKYFGLNMSPSKDSKIQELKTVTELKEWLLGRVADDNDIVIDDLQDDFFEQFEIEDEKKGIKVP